MSGSTAYYIAIYWLILKLRQRTKAISVGLLVFLSTNRNVFFPSIHQTPWLLFHCTQSSNLTPDPPKQSKALPIVRSTRPRLSLFTVSKSSKCRPPPAYVTGIEHHPARRSTSCSSIPLCSPSLSAAWIKNSEQYGSNNCIDSAIWKWATLPKIEVNRRHLGTYRLLTLVDFHICQCLPFVHGNKPLVSLATAAEVNYQLALISAKSSQDSI